ncbi:MAG: ribosome silencing factor [Mariprofundaceae bacterium]|nr:ribosome silencing factor [Mariprofundaceae bacterium]
MTQTTIEQLNQKVIEAIENVKGQDIITLNVTGRCSFADRFVLATGRTDRQLKALANSVRQVGHAHDLTARVDGLEALEWLVVDLGDIVVHLFLPEVRESFQLERLWSTPVESANESPDQAT